MTPSAELSVRVCLAAAVAAFRAHGLESEARHLEQARFAPYERLGCLVRAHARADLSARARWGLSAFGARQGATVECVDTLRVAMTAAINADPTDDVYIAMLAARARTLATRSAG